MKGIEQFKNHPQQPSPAYLRDVYGGCQKIFLQTLERMAENTPPELDARRKPFTNGRTGGRTIETIRVLLHRIDAYMNNAHTWRLDSAIRLRPFHRLTRRPK